MKVPEINVSQAREQLRLLLSKVHRTGRPVVITRHGEPQAVLVSYEQYRRTFSNDEEQEWRLCGSMQVNPDVDIDEAISKVRESINESLHTRSKEHSGP
jgi:prevent-host-death family protein